MDVESHKKFSSGFVLREADVRRLAETIADQFDKLNSGSHAKTAFRILLRNGVLISTEQLDDVLRQENSGSSEILKVEAEWKEDVRPEQESPSTVTLEFRNADDSGDPGVTSMRFHVFGHDRDWVFVTSSMLEERLERLRRFAPNQLLGGQRGPVRLLGVAFFPMVLVALVSVASAMLKEKQPAYLEPLMVRWRSGQLKDPVEALLLIEKARYGADSRLLSDGSPATLVGVGIVLLALLLLSAFLIRYYPVYNFCWGEYAEVFKRREEGRKFWLIVVLLGIIVSVIGGIIANNIQWARPS